MRRVLQKWQVPLLWICQVLFLLRVLGQTQVALYAPAWLPPMDHWYSGLIPYPILLPLQILILMWMTVISYDNTRNAGLFYVTQPVTKRFLAGLSAFYFLAMVTRYVISMVLYPELRWFAGTIPIAFHCVLAAYIFLLTVGPTASETRNAVDRGKSRALTCAEQES